MEEYLIIAAILVIIVFLVIKRDDIIFEIKWWFGREEMAVAEAKPPPEKIEIAPIAKYSNPTAISFGSHINFDFDQTLKVFSKIIKTESQNLRIESSGKYLINENEITDIEGNNLLFHTISRISVLSNGGEVMINVTGVNIRLTQLSSMKEYTILNQAGIQTIDISADNRFLLLYYYDYRKRNEFNSLIEDSKLIDGVRYAKLDKFGVRKILKEEDYLTVWDLERNEHISSSIVSCDSIKFTSNNHILLVKKGGIELLKIVNGEFKSIKNIGIEKKIDKIAISSDEKYILFSTIFDLYLLDVSLGSYFNIGSTRSHFILGNDKLAFELDEIIVVELIQDLIDENNLLTLMKEWTWDENSLDRLGRLLGNSMSKYIQGVVVKCEAGDTDFHISIDLSGRELSDDNLPSINSILEKIKMYQDTHLQRFQLHLLDLSNNYLTRFPENGLISEYEILDASQNQFDNIETIISSSIIQLHNNNFTHVNLDMCHCYELDLSFNKITGISISTHNHPLELLYLNGNKLERITDMADLRNMTHLKFISIHGNELASTIGINDFREDMNIIFTRLIIEDLVEKFLFEYINIHRGVYKGNKYPISKIQDHILNTWSTQKYIRSILRNSIYDVIIDLIQTGRLVAQIDSDFLVLDKFYNLT